MSPVDLFYSYAHEDEALRNELAGHLKIMERRGVIRPWHDRGIAPGEAWDQAIDQALTTADLVLLLVSSDFLNSDYIWGVELATAMQRHARGETVVVPVLIRACDIEDAPFARLQGLPTDLRAVTSWPNRDEAWTDVAKGIRRAVQRIQIRDAAVPAAPAPVAHERPLFSDARDDGPDVLMGGAGAPPASVDEPAGADAAATTDALVERIVDSTVQQIAGAAAARGTPAIDLTATRHSSLGLIDVPDQKRILWVDDHPANNALETAALARLQIEVVSVTSTADALARLATDAEAFDLILSDWSRRETLGDAPSAAVALLRALRANGNTVPVLLYHGTYAPERRAALRAVALAAGAVGEAVQPDELFALIAAQFA